MKALKIATTIAACGFTLSGCSGEAAEDDYSIRAQLSPQVPSEVIDLIEAEVEARKTAPVRKTSGACPQYSDTVLGAGTSQQSIASICTEGGFEHFCILYDSDTNDGSGDLNNNQQGSSGEFTSVGFKQFLNAGQPPEGAFTNINTRCHVRNNAVTGAQPPTFTQNGTPLYTTHQYGAIQVNGAAVDKF